MAAFSPSTYSYKSARAASYGLMPRVAAAAMCILIVGCQASRMQLPDDLGAAERWSVEGRQGLKLRERIRFGPYEAHEVKRSWTQGRDAVNEPFERNERSQSYSFVLREGENDRWLVKCSSSLDKGTVRTPIIDADIKNRSALDCALSDADGSVTWLLSLHESREQPLTGRLHTGGDEYGVRGTNELENSLPTPATAGYYLTDGSRTVAAVETVNKGSVSIHSSIDGERRSLFAAAAAALLLLEDLRETIES